MEINILIDEGVEAPLDVGWLRGVVAQVLKAENLDHGIELGLVIAGEEKVHRLNRDYRGIDEPTDVLAFSATEEISADDHPFVHPPDGLKHLGEVIISYPQAVRQAEENLHPLLKETAILIIHGVLHLLGYDHDEPEEENRMRIREAEILRIIEGGQLEGSRN